MSINRLNKYRGALKKAGRGVVEKKAGPCVCRYLPSTTLPQNFNLDKRVNFYRSNTGAVISVQSIKSVYDEVTVYG
jgi:hypothetical protein